MEPHEGNESAVRPEAVEIASRVRPALTKLYVTYFRTAEHSELSGPQLSLLQRLQDFGPSRIRQLADAEGVRMPTASNTINQLERQGLVSRARATEDRRGVTVELTDLGKRKLEQVGEERTNFLADMFATLDDDNLRNFSIAADAINALADSYTQTVEQQAASHHSQLPSEKSAPAGSVQ